MGAHTGIGYIVIVFYLTNLCVTNGLVKTPPLITTQPASDEIYFMVADITNFGKPVKIECIADGEPEPHYHWTKNDQIFQFEENDDRIARHPKQGTLVITKPKNEDAGEYKCFATNELGVAMSNSVFLRKSVLNSFKNDESQKIDVTEGSPFKLECNAPEGVPKPNLNWMYHYVDGRIKSINNSRLVVDPDGTLWFSNVTLDDKSEDFYYTCVVTSVTRNEYKLGNRKILNVIPINDPITNNKLVKQYVSNEVIVGIRGKKIEIYCIYGGTPLPEILWVKNDQIIEWNDRITTKSEGRIFVIKNLQLTDEGHYACTTFNKGETANMVTNKFELKIEDFPNFINIPKIQNCKIGDKVEFDCKASGIPDPAIKRIHNGKSIDQIQPNTRINVLNDKIVINNVTQSDIGNYGCIAVNKLGSVYREAYLNVVTEPSDNPIGKKVVVHCKVRTIGEPKYQWSFNGLKVSNSRYQILQNGDLEIDNVGISDEGTYRCHVESKHGGIAVEVEFDTQLILINNI